MFVAALVMIIHYDGTGISAGLRAWIQNIVVPRIVNQPLWGSRAHSIGAGLQLIHAKEFSVSNLLSAICDADDNDICQPASPISKALMNENGAGKSIERVEKYSKPFFAKNYELQIISVRSSLRSKRKEANKAMTDCPVCAKLRNLIF